MNRYGITPDNITEARLEQLIDNEVREGVQIEYKLKLPSNKPDDKKEMLADISSFANTGGGLLLFGISEKQENGKNTGIPECLIGLEKCNVDQETLRIESLVRDGLEPRIIGTTVKPITLSNKKHILAVFIPQSWTGPHAVTIGKSMRFYRRKTGGKYPLDVDELRSSFLQSDIVETKLRQFSLERVARIEADDLTYPMEESTRVIAHIQPMNRQQDIDITALEKDHVMQKLIYNEVKNCRFNLDGLLLHSTVLEGAIDSYTQVFRNGTIEGATSSLVRKRESGIAYIAFEDAIIRFFSHYYALLLAYKVDLPYLLSLRLLGFKGIKLMPKDAESWEEGKHIFDRENINLPEILVDGSDLDMKTILRPILNATWQAAGWPKSWSYDNDGNWYRT